MNTALMFSKQKDEWRTPQPLFDALHAEFGFELDVAATVANAKCAAYFTAADNALVQDWGGRICFMNPPYSQNRWFMSKAAREAMKGATIVALVPARTCTRWFHAYVWDRRRHRPQDGVELRFLKGRVKFGGMPDVDDQGRRRKKSGAPFPSAVIVFRPGVSSFELW